MRTAWRFEQRRSVTNRETGLKTNAIPVSGTSSSPGWADRADDWGRLGGRSRSPGGKGLWSVGPCSDGGSSSRLGRRRAERGQEDDPHVRWAPTVGVASKQTALVLVLRLRPPSPGAHGGAQIPPSRHHHNHPLNAPVSSPFYSE